MPASIAVAATGQATRPRRYSFKSQVFVPSHSFHLPGSHKTELGVREGGRVRGAGQGPTHPRKAQVPPWVTSSWDRNYTLLSLSFLPVSLLVS